MKTPTLKEVAAYIESAYIPAAESFVREHVHHLKRENPLRFTAVEMVSRAYEILAQEAIDKKQKMYWDAAKEINFETNAHYKARYVHIDALMMTHNIGFGEAEQRATQLARYQFEKITWPEMLMKEKGADHA